MAFNLLNGVNIAGANTARSEGAFSAFWVLVPVDALFFVYYGVYREERWFYPNVLVWVLSNLLRGWNGMFLIIIMLEWCRAGRAGRLNLRLISIVLLGVLLAYPVVSNLKWFFRTYDSVGLNLSSVFASMSENLSGEDYLNLIGEGFAHIVGRVQVTSLVVEVMRLSEVLQTELAKGNFAGFWAEGLHGIVFYRLVFGAPLVPAGVAFTQYATFGWDFVVGDWNTNIGYVSWFFIAPFLVPLYLVYTIFLGWLSWHLIKKIGDTPLSRDMVWVAWLIYLMPPWFGAFVNFIHAMLLFLLFQFVASRANFVFFRTNEKNKDHAEALF
jgi:hypothetical protein